MGSSSFRPSTAEQVVGVVVSMIVEAASDFVLQAEDVGE
jgi:hypothetical protein